MKDVPRARSHIRPYGMWSEAQTAGGIDRLAYVLTKVHTPWSAWQRRA